MRRSSPFLTKPTPEIGPWWLAYDHVKDYFKTWSGPVYRWLLVCVQRPLLKAAAQMAASKSNITTISNPNDNNSNTNASGGRDRDGGGKASKAPSWAVTASVVLVFFLSGLLHEATGYLGMRRTIFPMNTFFLLLSASMFPTWDLIFPVVERETPPRSGVIITNGDVSGSSPGGDGGGGGESLGRSSTTMGGSAAAGAEENQQEHSEKLLMRRSKKYEGDVGIDRGLGVVVFCFLSSTSMKALYDFLAWQWWRMAFLEAE